MRELIVINRNADEKTGSCGNYFFIRGGLEVGNPRTDTGPERRGENPAPRLRAGTRPTGGGAANPAMRFCNSTASEQIKIRLDNPIAI